MYIPPHFKEDGKPALNRVMAEAGLATIVSCGGSGPAISHVPVHFDPDSGENGSLSWHLSKANDHCAVLRAGAPTVAIFLGSDAYITPSWYEEKTKTGKVVPTWNYVAIHAAGPVEAFDDPDRLLALVEALTDTHEADRETPWAVTDAPADFIGGQLKGIAGFSLAIETLEGKWKLGQNRSAKDQATMAEGLSAEPREAARAAGALMKQRNGNSTR